MMRFARGGHRSVRRAEYGFLCAPFAYSVSAAVKLVCFIIIFL